jgi:hypothetical protein
VPVSNAEVTGSYEHFGTGPNIQYFRDSSRITTRTDSNGCFIVKDLKGTLLFFNTIEKEGYVFNLMENKNRAFGYDINQQHKFMPDKNDPVVFILHKKNQPGLVSEKTDSQIIDKRGEIYYVDLFKGFMCLEKWMKKIDSDIILTVKTSDNGATFNIDLKTTDNNSGLVCSDSEPFGAPDSGYQREINFSISKGQEIKKNIYFRGTKGEYGEIFARLEIQSHLGNRGLNFVSAVYVNLEGSKNLEYDSQYTLKELSRISGYNIAHKSSDEFKAAVQKALINVRQKRELSN